MCHLSHASSFFEKLLLIGLSIDELLSNIEVLMKIKRLKMTHSRLKANLVGYPIGVAHIEHSL